MLDVHGRYDESNYPGSKKSLLLFHGEAMARQQAIDRYGVDPDNNPTSTAVADYKATFALDITQPVGAVIAPVDGKTRVGYGLDEVVDLVITEEAGYEFQSWGDDATGTELTTTVVVNAAKTVSAVVEIDKVLTIIIDPGEGSVALDPVEPLSGAYPHNTSVSITATPEATYNFTAWTGADVPVGHENDNPLTLVMSADKTITADFTLI